MLTYSQLIAGFTVLGAVVAVIAVGGISVDRNSAREAATTTAEVIRVVDGDTVQVRITGRSFESLPNGSTQSVRLIGIDAPEINWEEETDACFGFPARDYLQQQIGNENVVLRTDPRQPTLDEYDRLLAYVYHQRDNVNRQVVRNGFAREFTVNRGYAQRSSFRQSERTAQQNNLGLWDVCK